MLLLLLVEIKNGAMMKRVVWANKSNSQLCVTIPKNSGIGEGDIVSIEKDKINTVVYSSVTADLFHYGHLRLLEKANELGDLHICSVLTDEAISSYKQKPVAGLKERSAIISALRCVDMVMTQYSLNPSENLRKIHEQFPDADIIVVYGSNWKDVPGREYIDEIGAKVVQPEFYEKLSTENIIKKINSSSRKREDGK
ncbi:adenylyltransferase/cytidyltransferase family protein [Candidatus Woesearchaeota archaeon]|nr:adenylyltransferase/cytidyltransferase family protein [Candidatus Woesearchaeota archaeon]